MELFLKILGVSCGCLLWLVLMFWICLAASFMDLFTKPVDKPVTEMEEQ